jgi:4-hydroxybenzoate polyprenyltransferase
LILNWLQFFRFNGAFSAISASLCGYILFTETYDYVHALGLCTISLCLFISGMGFNDIADRNKDSVLRPERPLPSGRINLTHAIVVCILLTLIPIIISFFMSKFHLYSTLILIILIAIYNFWAKSNALASVSITSCRVANFILGIGPSLLLNDQTTFPILIIALHTFSIMKMADGEDESKKLNSFFYIYQACVIILLIKINYMFAGVWLLFLILVTRNKIWTERGHRIKTVGQLVVGFCILDMTLLLCHGKLLYAIIPLTLWIISILASKKIMAG